MPAPTPPPNPPTPAPTPPLVSPPLAIRDRLNTIPPRRDSRNRPRDVAPFVTSSSPRSRAPPHTAVPPDRSPAAVPSSVSSASASSSRKRRRRSHTQSPPPPPPRSCPRQSRRIRPPSGDRRRAATRWRPLASPSQNPPSAVSRRARHCPWRPCTGTRRRPRTPCGWRRRGGPSASWFPLRLQRCARRRPRRPPTPPGGRRWKRSRRSGATWTSGPTRCGRRNAAANRLEIHEQRPGGGGRYARSTNSDVHGTIALTYR